MVTPLCLVCGKTVKLSNVSVGIGPRYSLVADEDIKNPKKQKTFPPVVTPSGLPTFVSNFAFCIFFFFNLMLYLEIGS